MLQKDPEFFGQFVSASELTNKVLTCARQRPSQIKVETNVSNFCRGSAEVHVSPAAAHLRAFSLKRFPHSTSVSVWFLIGRESCSLPLLSSENMLLGCQEVKQSGLCVTVLVSWHAKFENELLDLTSLTRIVLGGTLVIRAGCPIILTVTLFP